MAYPVKPREAVPSVGCVGGAKPALGRPEHADEAASERLVVRLQNLVVVEERLPVPKRVVAKPLIESVAAEECTPGILVQAIVML